MTAPSGPHQAFVPATRGPDPDAALDPLTADLTRHILTFDPGRPELVRFSARALPPPHAAAVPWPAGLEPRPQTAGRADPDGPLPAADVLVVTWTVAEARALADLLTPGRSREDWTPYRHGWADYLPQIRRGAPSRAAGALAHYAETRIGAQRVLCLKSELHLSQDGPDLPVRTLWQQIIRETGARLVISTGTAGAVGSTVGLGDVVIGANVRFDCTATFARAPFATAAYTAANPAGRLNGYLEMAEHTLIPVNAASLPSADRPPTLLLDRPDAPIEVLTTDFFAFDDAEDSYSLRRYDSRARAVEMGDAVLGLVATTDLSDPPDWVIVRNASDPQIPAGGTLADRARQAGAIYEQYGYWTTVGSAITCWALVAARSGSSSA